MSNILVTGGAGYIGSHTCVELLNSNKNVISIDNFSNSLPSSLKMVEKITNKKLISYKGDIRNFPLLDKIFKNHKIDAVIHFAGLKAVGESVASPLLYYDNNVLATINLLNVMKKNFVKKIIFSSSATVYGNESSPPFKEDMPTGKVSSPYGRTKYIIEEILKDLKRSDKNCGISILRYFNPVGAHESSLIGENPKGIPNNLMPLISRVAFKILPELTIFSNNYPTRDGTCVRDYIHVVDLAKGHVLALDKILNINAFDIYNLGSGVGYSVLEMIKAFEEVSGLKINYKIGSKRNGDLASLYSDPAKAKEELGFHASSDIKKMCLDTFNWQNNCRL